MKDEGGRVLSNGSKVCDRWKEYFDGQLNVSESGRAEITARPEMNDKCLRKQMQMNKKSSGTLISPSTNFLE